MNSLLRLPFGKYGAILADPPWRFETWSAKGMDRAPDYETLGFEDIAALPVERHAARHAVLFLWISWPMLEHGLHVIDRWGFKYKTCAFSWIKAEIENDLPKIKIGNGYWTRANSEVCLLATRGQPKRLHKDVRQAIIEPAREHSRKPDCVYERIERLVRGPYLELFARQTRPGWRAWGNEITKFDQRGSWDDMWTRPFDYPERL